MNRIIKKTDLSTIAIFWSALTPPTILFYITSMATVHEVITFIEFIIAFTFSLYLPVIFFRITDLLYEKEELK